MKFKKEVKGFSPCSNSFFKNKKAQVTIFIILAIVIVAGVIGYFVFKDNFKLNTIPVEIEPIYNTFLSCIEQDTLVGIDVLESQAGYIYLPEFESGSSYMPFSSQLDFLENPIPYWYYVSGNNIPKEQIPSKTKMQNELERFIEEKINTCVFDFYYEQGFEISLGEPKADVKIEDNEVKVDLDLNLKINKEEDTFLVSNHKTSVTSQLGTLYDSARKIYEKEQKEMFLEEYGIDILRLYAPVDGVELTCSPLTWNADEVFNELQEAIEINTAALRTNSGDYVLKNKQSQYFVIDTEIDEEIRFINSRNWTYGFEVNPSKGALLMASPVGNQPGLGILGFCYVPYHFVYDIKYPILVQVCNKDEIFQFPLAVVIKGNQPREPLEGAIAVELEIFDFCEYKNTLTQVNVYDNELNPVDAEISYECSGTICDIGKTENGILEENFPQCANGFIRVNAEGFEEEKYFYSTTIQGTVDIILNKIYELDVNLKLDNRDYPQNAIINFVSDKSSKTILYPEQNLINLSEGQYQIQVYIYKNSSLKLDATEYNQCIEVPKEGLGGLFGLTQEKCFDVEIPAQIISNALSGGGKQEYYILESELKESNVIDINSKSLPTPISIEQLQENYNLFETKKLNINFK